MSRVPGGVEYWGPVDLTPDEVRLIARTRAEKAMQSRPTDPVKMAHAIAIVVLKDLREVSLSSKWADESAKHCQELHIAQIDQKLAILGHDGNQEGQANQAEGRQPDPGAG